VLAGVPVLDRDELELTRRLRASGFLDTAEVLELAYDSQRRVVALTVPDREAIMRTLEDSRARRASGCPLERARLAYGARALGSRDPAVGGTVMRAANRSTRRLHTSDGPPRHNAEREEQHSSLSVDELTSASSAPTRATPQARSRAR
jgi:hypothetical protein